MVFNIKGFGEESSKINYTGVNEYFFLVHIKMFKYRKLLKSFVFSKVIDWLVTYSDPVSQWTAHPTFVLCESIFLFGAFIMIIHGNFIRLALSIGIHIIKLIIIFAAFKKGGRWPWLFFAAMGHGLVVELIAYFVSFIDNFWHAQGLITLFDRRMALYIAIVCKYRNVNDQWIRNC